MVLITWLFIMIEYVFSGNLPVLNLMPVCFLMAYFSRNLLKLDVF